MNTSEQADSGTFKEGPEDTSTENGEGGSSAVNEHTDDEVGAFK